MFSRDAITIVINRITEHTFITITARHKLSRKEFLYPKRQMLVLL